MKKETEKLFSAISFIVFVVTLVLSFMNTAFIPSAMLMLSLFLFSICYLIRDSRKILLYILFALGVSLIIGSLVYTAMRLS